MAIINGKEILLAAHINTVAEIVQETGSRTDAVMSQDAVTKALANVTPSQSVEVVQETGDSTTAVMSQKAATDAFVHKVTNTSLRRAYINDNGTETTMLIIHDYGEEEENKELQGHPPYDTHNIACRNNRGAITVANPLEKYDSVNLQTLETVLASYAKLSDFEGVFDELHEYAQNIILWGGVIK